MLTTARCIRREDRRAAALVTILRRESRTAALVAVLLLGAVPLYGQEVTGTIEGRVTDAGEQPLAGVEIEVRGISTPGRRVVVTDANGRFRALALAGGSYRATFERLGFRRLAIERIGVQVGASTALGDVQLEREAVAIDPLVVEAARAAVDPLSTTLSATLDHATLELLPVGRDYLSAVVVLPQANESYYGDGLNIAGGTGFDNAYFMDGVNVTEPYRAQGATRLPFNFIDHVDLRTGGFEAEHGRSLGGIVNVITRSGSNQFKGTAFGYFAGSALSKQSARGVDDLRTGRFKRYDAGFGVGGPVRKDRLWYYAAYDRSVESSDVSLQGLGTRADETVSDLFAGKLTWQPNAYTDVSLTVAGDPTSRDLVGNEFFLPLFGVTSLANPDPFLGRSRYGGVLMALRGSRVFGSNLVTEFMVGRAASELQTGAATERGRREALLVDRATGSWSGGHGNAWDHESTRWSAAGAVTAYRGEHSLKAGFQFENNRLNEVWNWRGDGPGGQGIILKFADDFYLYPTVDFNTVAENRVVSLYTHASVLVTSRLRINPGFRWDGQYFRGRDAGLSGSIPDQYQPRIGLIYYPGRAESQKLTATAGRLYEQLPNLPVSFYYGGLYQEVHLWGHDPYAGGQPFLKIQETTVGPKRLAGQYYDEYTLGYQRSIAGERALLSVRGVRRELRKVIAGTSVVESASEGLVVSTMSAGNPGYGALDYFPKPRHDYSALELLVQTTNRTRSHLQLAYTLSRVRGNYTGLFDQETRVPNPNGGSNYTDTIRTREIGLLPNDRPHVLKLVAAYRFTHGLNAATFLSWQSGTPLSELGAHPTDAFSFMYLRPRGSAGRLPSVWDWNVHVSQLLPRVSGLPGEVRVRADVLHAFSRRRPVDVIQQRYLARDEAGNPVGLNPLYGAALAHQPPMTLRVGVEVGF